jgi:hypothetical protein
MADAAAEAAAARDPPLSPRSDFYDDGDETYATQSGLAAATGLGTESGGGSNLGAPSGGGMGAPSGASGLGSRSGLGGRSGLGAASGGGGVGTASGAPGLGRRSGVVIPPGQVRDYFISSYDEVRPTPVLLGTMYFALLAWPYLLANL